MCLNIIDIENIEIVIEKENNKNLYKIYDDESLEYTGNIQSIKHEGIKVGKRVRLFS